MDDGTASSWMAGARCRSEPDAVVGGQCRRVAACCVLHTAPFSRRGSPSTQTVAPSHCSTLTVALTVDLTVALTVALTAVAIVPWLRCVFHGLLHFAVPHSPGEAFHLSLLLYYHYYQARRSTCHYYYIIIITRRGVPPVTRWDATHHRTTTR